MYRVWIDNQKRHEVTNLKPHVWSNLKVVVGNVYDQSGSWHKVAIGTGQQ